MGGEILVSISLSSPSLHVTIIIMSIIKVLLLLVPAALLPGMWSVLFVFAGYVPKHRLITFQNTSCYVPKKKQVKNTG